MHDDGVQINHSRPIVIGLYGVSGSGKSTLLNELRSLLDSTRFAFFEGSEVISSVVPGGLESFLLVPDCEKEAWRKAAIETIRSECEESSRIGLVAGHLSFWAAELQAPRPVYTEVDLSTYTHILYLRTPSATIVDRCARDVLKRREDLSACDVDAWQSWELGKLRQLCRDRSILLLTLTAPLTAARKLSQVLLNLVTHDEQHNSEYLTRVVDDAFQAPHSLETALVLDADKTLTMQDAGDAYWQRCAVTQGGDRGGDVMRQLFSGPMGYTHAAFQQATLLYEESADEYEFDALCDEIAHEITLYPQILGLLRHIREHEHVRAVIVTSGIALVWKKVMANEGFGDRIKVIGGARLSEGLVVTASVKARVVSRLREHHGLYVWAFGDSPLDLDMLCEADQSVVVVGHEATRSKSMDEHAQTAITERGLRARQAVLSEGAPIRLDTDQLPLIDMGTRNFLDDITCRRISMSATALVNATDKGSTKLLVSPMRDAASAGPSLRDAHCMVGWYLAVEYLTDLLGTEEYDMQHVQGHLISGTRLLYEQNTIVVALMRGGEPMAFGVSRAFPLAMFVHAKQPTDIEPHHLASARNILLVDSVVNSGDTALRFIRHVRQLNRVARIVLVAGVVQADFVSKIGGLTGMQGDRQLRFLSLRVSKNKFTGSGTTDTGNRLFNTVHLA